MTQEAYESRRMGRAISVVVPTYRRAEDLRRCIRAVQPQLAGGDELVVVHRAGDGETAELVMQLRSDKLKPVEVTTPGQIAALATGLQQARNPIIVFTDDDAVPRHDWLYLIREHFRDPSIGAVGGRDVIHPKADQQGAPRVGVITSWGKVI